MMETPESSASTGLASVPMYHWLISGAALIWNLFGFMIYLVSVRATPEQMAANYTPEQVAYIEAVPVWAVSANAIAVNAGVIACVLLIMRKSLALPFFLLSIAALVVQDLHAFVITDATAAFGMQPAYIQGTVMLIAISMIFYTRSVKSRGLLT